MSRFEEYMSDVVVPAVHDALVNYAPEYEDAPKGGPFVWVRLSDGVYQACLREARSALKERGTEIDNQNYVSHAEELETEVQWQLLWRAMRDPERKGQTSSQPYPHLLAKSAAELAEYLPPQARVALIQRYTDWVRGLAPAESRTLSDKEIRSLQLQVRGNPNRLRELSPGELRDAVRSMLDRVSVENAQVE